MSFILITISLIFDSFLIYYYYQTMFGKLHQKLYPLSAIGIIFLLQIISVAITIPFVGDSSVSTSIIRTMITFFILLAGSMCFISDIPFRIFAIVCLIAAIAICEEIACMFLLRLTNTSLSSTELTENFFMGISFVAQLFEFVMISILHILHRQKLHIMSLTYCVLLSFIPMISTALVLLPPVAQIALTSTDAYVLLTIFLLIINIVVYVLLQYIIHSEALILENENLSKQVLYQKNKYQQLGNAYKNIRSFMHDTKKHLFYIQNCVEEQQYDQIIPYSTRIMSDLESRYCTINTGNLVVDSFVSNLLLQTQKHNITLTTSLKIQNESIPVDDYHMTIILGNILDNALEACMEENGGKIDIKMQMVNQSFVIHVTNTYHPDPDKTLPDSFEDFDFIHGYGLKNVKASSATYGGFCLIDYKNNIYSVSVIIPQQP